MEQNTVGSIAVDELLKQVLSTRGGTSDRLQPPPRAKTLLRDYWSMGHPYQSGEILEGCPLEGPLQDPQQSTPQRMQPMGNPCWRRDIPEELWPLEDPAGKQEH